MTFLRCSLILTVLVFSSLVRADEPPFGAGFKFISLNDPLTSAPMKAVLFYPVKPHSETTSNGPLLFAATEDSKPEKGSYPLVVLSHGSGGSMFSHHDNATFLARHGFIVAAIEHPGDNFHDDSLAGTDRVLIGRNQQISALINFLLQTPPYKNSIDASRIGVSGFSTGGYTALTLLGAVPKFELLENYCNSDSQSVLCMGGRQVKLSEPPLQTATDERIRAAFVMSPVAAFFDRDSLAEIVRPVYLIAAGADEELSVRLNARVLKNILPSMIKYREIPTAGHFVFLAPCTSEMAQIAPVPCSDPPGIDREEVHTSINNMTLGFFKSYLYGQ